MRHFFYATVEEERGPVSESSLLELFRSRAVTAETLVRCKGMADWQPLAEVFPRWLTEDATAAAATTGPEAENAICAVSGRLLPIADMIRFGDVWVSPEARAVYLERLQQGPPVREEDGFTPATIGQRFAGILIDALVLGLALAVMVVIAVLSVPDTSETVEEGRLTPVGILVIGVFLVGTAVYEIGMTATRGATLGKMAVRTCVIDLQGVPPGWGAASGRWALKILIPCFPIVGHIYKLVSVIMALVDTPWRRAIHDRWANTRVVQRHH